MDTIKKFGNNSDLSQNNTKSVYDRLKEMPKGTQIKVMISYLYDIEEITPEMISFWSMYNAQLFEE